jgi:hypothetical protein
MKQNMSSERQVRVCFEAVFSWMNDFLLVLCCVVCAVESRQRGGYKSV